MIVRSVDIEVLLRAEYLIRCTRHSPQSRVRLRLVGTSVRLRSPRYNASSTLCCSQIWRSKGLPVSYPINNMAFAVGQLAVFQGANDEHI
jgi:hypothetical protein